LSIAWDTAASIPAAIATNDPYLSVLSCSIYASTSLEHAEVHESTCTATTAVEGHGDDREKGSRANRPKSMVPCGAALVVGY
jgi:hypothetical protein